MKSLIVTVVLAGITLSWPSDETKDFVKHNLKNKDFHDEDFRRAIFDCADLRYANLSGATLEKASFVAANLQCTNLRRANISGADFTDSLLENAKLTDAKAWDAKFRNCTIFLARAEPMDWESIGVVRNVPGAADIIAAYDDATCGTLSFRRSDMRNAKIIGNAEGVDFFQCDLRGADLSEVQNLEKANLRKSKYDSDTRWTINPEEMGAIFDGSESTPLPPPHACAGKWLILKGLGDAKDHGVLNIWRDGLLEWDPELGRDDPKLFAGEWNPLPARIDVIELKLEQSGEVWTATLITENGKRELTLTNLKGGKLIAVEDVP